jgi:hypothetical protein
LRTGIRGGRFLCFGAVVIGVLGSVLATPARAQTGDAYQVISMVNSVRASVGAPPVSIDGGLSAVAQTWAGVMAAQGTISHNPSLGSLVDGWTSLAENVGVGSSLDQVQQALVSSPQHYANMTGSNYTSAGAGVVAAGGQVFVVQVFMQGGAVAPPQPPVPEPEPYVEPAPVYRSPPPEPEPAHPEATPPPEVTPPAPVEPPVPVVVAPTDPTVWLSLVLQQLQALDGALG